MTKRVQIHPRKKQKVLERDNFACVNCSSTGDFNALEVDHIIPVCNGGTNDYDNLQTLCYKCNMNKRFGKITNKQSLISLSPLEKLELIKNRLNEYKDLTYAEFKVVFTQDDLFMALRLDLLYLNDLFFEVTGKKKNTLTSNSKYIRQRDILIFLLHKYANKTLRELSDLLKEFDISMSYQQIAKINTKFIDIATKSDEIA